MTRVEFLSAPGNSAFVAHCVGADLPSVVSLVGAGGKTSTLFWLAQALLAGGQRVLVTTTTRMFPPRPENGATLLVAPDFTQRLAALQALPRAPGIVALFSQFDQAEGKMIGCAPDEIDEFKDMAVADVILVEADGARHCTLKAPAAHEPCLPSSSNTVIALSGAAPLGHPANPAAIHRWPQFAAITGLEAGEHVSADALSRLLAHPLGMFKNAPLGAARHWLVNASGGVDAAVPAMLAQLSRQHQALDGAWLGDIRQPNPFSHAWVRSAKSL